MASTLKRVLIGRPLASDEADHQRISKTIGLAVFSSDAISSTAYATGEILIVLVGAAGMVQANGEPTTNLLKPIAVLVVILLALVANSYRETIHAYPDGGGAYVVARENLGETPSLVAGASLLVDYVLTVAVSIAAGVLALYSFIPSLERFRVELCLLFLIILTVGNLRGVKESGKVFSVPTYLYIGMLLLFIGWAGVQHFRGNLHVFDPTTAEAATSIKLIQEEHGPFIGGVSLYIFARAFASGAVALSGVEAISNGIPAFRKPTSKNAAATLGWMAVILGSTFFMISIIASWMQVVPDESRSALAIMGERVFGDTNPLFYVLQIATMAILILAANTAFADFPRLAAIIGKDGYLPRQFANRGDRLVFSNGILILAGAAAVLLIVFNGNVTLLIPLYAVGVFTSFTISQTGMVRHHFKERQKGWKLSMVNSTLGAIATFIVAAVVIISKFTIGAWIIVVLIPCIVVAFRGVRSHYNHVARSLRVPADFRAPETVPRHGVVVLVGGVNQSSLAAIRYARSVGSEDVVAVTVAIDEEEAARVRDAWGRFGLAIPLEIIESPFRDLTHTVVDYLDELDARWDHDYLTVVIPEFVLPHWWQGVFHNQSALALKLALKFRKDTVVVNVPFLLPEGEDEVLADMASMGLEMGEESGLAGTGPDQQPTIERIEPERNQPG
ncbi:APC family permease [Dermatobacter hominis]|uniref:APC family permease n=1 Tax=Dermatobacter hominis TaxID=2884263 RepID=UPI001D10F9FB|nr:APC family permease [Dermatobacter hominis]UDY37301.1 APC family permease [Dermatobacter hominis]